MPITDNFNDNSVNTDIWDKYEVDNGTVTEVNQQIECECLVNTDEAGLVTKAAHDISDRSVEIEVIENDSLHNMALYLCLTKVTDTEVGLEPNFYRIMKHNALDRLYVQRRTNGGTPVTLFVGDWAAHNGVLRIVHDGTNITFYENDIERASEEYGLSSTTVYIYFRGRGVTGYFGTDVFDNFITDIPIVITRSASAAIGLAGVSGRSFVGERSASATVSIVGTATRSWIGTRTASATLGLSAVAGRIKEMFRSASASMSVVGTAARSWIGSRSALGAFSMTGAADRMVSLTRSASASITIDPWLEGWAKRVKVTLDHNDIDAALSDLPHLVHISASSGHSGRDVSCVFDELGNDANRKKIAVTTSDGETQCYVEIEKWDDANEEAWLWVKVPNVSYEADTILYLYYDSSHADNDAYVGDTNSVPAENVWDPDFLMVQHQAGDSSPIRDSTSSDTDMTEGGDPTYLQAGPIDGEIDYDGNDYHLSAINVFDAIVGTDKGTMSLWIKTTTSVVASHLLLSIEGAYMMLLRYGEGGLLKTCWSGTHSDSARTTTQINTGAQFYIVSTYDGSNQRVYVNGNLEATDACDLYDITALNRATGLASNWDGLVSIDANIDEVRVSKTDRSVSWIKASYESGRDHLNDFGEEEIFTSFGASRILHALRGAPASISTVGSPVRTLSAFRSAGATIGMVGVSGRILSAFRSAAASLSLVGTADRMLSAFRSASATLGMTGISGRTLHAVRSAVANVGMVGTALRGWIGSRSASATMSVVGTSARILHSIRSIPASMSQIATATRTVIFTRTASGAIAVQGVAGRVVNNVRTAAATISVSAVSGRIVNNIRSAPASMNLVAEGKRVYQGVRSAAASISIVAVGSIFKHIIRGIVTLRFAGKTRILDFVDKERNLLLSSKQRVLDLADKIRKLKLGRKET